MVELIVCINMIHISPWSSAQGLFAGAGRVLNKREATATLFLYGPYRFGGQHTAPSNAAFDASLRSRDPRWGVRDVEAIDKLAAAENLQRIETIPMPANNFSLIFRRQN